MPLCRPRGSALRALFAAAALALALPFSAACQLRVATWNLTNYGGGREAALKTSLYGTFQGRRMAPDVLVAQEVVSAAGAAALLSVLNTAPGSPGDWMAAPFRNGPDTDNAFFYRASKVTFTGTTVVSAGGNGSPRDVLRYDVTVNGYTPAATPRLALYSAHLKAGNSSNDRAQRLVDAVRIRDDAQALAPGTHFVVAGDFNLDSSSEASYQELTGAQANNAGRAFDPIKTPGSWDNNAAFRFVHTQDQTSQMDSRYDFLLVSGNLLDESGLDYDGNEDVAFSTTTWDDPNHSYTVWGNDGGSFNAPLRTVGNQMVGAEIAQALRDSTGFDRNGNPMAGHLPLFLDLSLPTTGVVPGPPAAVVVLAGLPLIAARLRRRAARAA